MPGHGHDAGQDRQTGPAIAVGAATRWEIYAASSIGADHLRGENPNQDAFAIERFGPSGPDGLAVLAVADGHGDARHFRSDRGSRLAVAAATAAAGTWGKGQPAGTMPSRAAASQLISDIVMRWRAAVAADLAADPVGSEQAATWQDDPPEIPYGTTLLLIAVRADVAVLAQIGDGDIFLAGQDGRLVTPVPGDRRLDGTQTTSLCQPDAISAFRVALVSLARTPVYAILAATDGFGNAQADPAWQARWAADLVGLGRTHGVSWIGEQLKGWVAACASSDGSGDDTTAALALNPAAMLTRPDTVTVPSPATVLPSADQSTLVAMPSQQRAGLGQDDRAVQREMTHPLAPRLPSGPGRHAGRGSGFRVPLPATSARWWLAGAVILAVAVGLYLFVSGRAPGPAPVRPTPSVTPLRTAGPSRTPARTPGRTTKPTPSASARHSRRPAAPPALRASRSASPAARPKATSPASNPSGGPQTRRAARK